MASSESIQPFACRCSLRKCIQGDLEIGMARVEVQSVMISAEEREHMEISWSPLGDAKFHDICWKAVLDSLRMDNPFALSDIEKSFISEAKITAEYFDSFEKLDSEATRIVKMLQTAKYAIAFTGAGISTSCGICDYRGKCGQWTLRDRIRKFGVDGVAQSDATKVAFEALRPSYTHESLQKLVSLGLIHHIISQNVDCLHRLSGVPRDKLSELHGNMFHERCEKCGARYERPYAVSRRIDCISSHPSRVCIHCHFDHRTGRLCERKGCDGFLMNTIINFGDCLEKRVLSTAEDHAKLCDLILCLGSTLRVSPACELLEMGQAPGKLIICNRQTTPFDHLCYEVGTDGVQHGSRVFGDCDALMRRVMRGILSADELRDWEGASDSRLSDCSNYRLSMSS